MTPTDHGMEAQPRPQSPQGAAGFTPTAQSLPERGDDELPYSIQASPSVVNLHEARAAEGGVGHSTETTEWNNQHYAINEGRSMEPYITDANNDFHSFRESTGTRPLPNGVRTYNHPELNGIFGALDQIHNLDNREQEQPSDHEASSSSEEDETS